MPSTPDRKSYLYAERLRERLPRALQEAREAVPITKYGLAQKCGITRQMIGQIEAGKANPTLPVLSQISDGLGLPLWELLRRLEDDGAALRSRTRQR